MTDLWWATAEATLDSQNVKDDLHSYNFVFAPLPPRASALVCDIILTPPAIGKCNALKTTLLDAYGLSPQRKHDVLSSLTDLGDKRPSEMLSYMESLADIHLLKSSFFKHMFCSLLPATVRTLLAT
ncbi:hypothetical protein TCAL_14236 [Tigriopus californicus]|uniref:DUF7041 domain-containing protein n=1 Tax=Tigriopus californicus TaxID=6832 RepID=A0A553NUU6_TIGCA|nr:uncharacterized protein LOC131888534 [Tigriopus californicus]TRY69207.1 hypothetical protein TCAL_14236 [Tigriopus californicus]